MILTKPLGTGIISTAIKREMADSQLIERVISVMSQLNRTAAEVMSKYDISACTDVTGFGLLGHLKEMTVGSRVDAKIFSNAVPIISEALGFAAAGVIPGGTENNLDYVTPFIRWSDKISRTLKYLLCDAQTSGGLLIAVHPSESEKLALELKAKGISDATVIGEISSSGKGLIDVW